MLACLDVFYAEADATAACILFDGWRATAPSQQQVRHFTGVAAYESGSFYRRELPCLVGILDDVAQRPEAIIVDGYVWLGPAGQPGLGAHLYDALGRTTPVIGVAKTVFHGAPAVEILRGASKTPLYVTAVGMGRGSRCGEHPLHERRVPDPGHAAARRSALPPKLNGRSLRNCISLHLRQEHRTGFPQRPGRSPFVRRDRVGDPARSPSRGR